VPDTVGRYPVPSVIVDRLPQRLWRPANLHWIFGGLLHFCVDTVGGRSVRTITWKSRLVGTGYRPFVGGQLSYHDDVDDDLDIDWGHRLLLAIAVTSALSLALLASALAFRRPRFDEIQLAVSNGSAGSSVSTAAWRSNWVR
jgi:hypothetical protein